MSAHSSQALAPAAAAKAPCGHGTQCEALLVSVPLPCVPAAHPTHDVWPMAVWNCPSAHCWQYADESCAPVPYVPAAQWLQVETPSCDENVPGAHATQYAISLDWSPPAT